MRWPPLSNAVSLLLVLSALLALITACAGTSVWSAPQAEQERVQARKQAERVASGGSDPNARVGDGKPALFVAVEARDCASAEKLLTHGADTSATWQGWTPLQAAARVGGGSCADVLLHHGADPNLRVRGAPPLYLAAQRGDAETIRALLAYGAWVGVGYSRQLPIQAAAIQGDADTVQVLLAGGADPNTPGPSGENPMHLAAVRGHEDAAAVLLDAGSRLTEIPSDPWTTARSFEWAARYRSEQGDAARSKELRDIACEYFPQAVDALERQDDTPDEDLAYAKEATQLCKDRAGDRGIPPPLWTPPHTPL